MTATLLLVEDEPLIQEVLVGALTETGFAVVTACDGTQALAKLAADATRFNAIITDIRLGVGPDGWEVARSARGRRRDLPIVYISADSAHEWPVEGVAGSGFLAKPFRLIELLAALTRLLSASPGEPVWGACPPWGRPPPAGIRPSHFGGRPLGASADQDGIASTLNRGTWLRSDRHADIFSESDGMHAAR